MIEPPWGCVSYSLLSAASWSVKWELRVAVAAIISSGRLRLWVAPSSITGSGVIWLPSTLPERSSTSWASTRAVALGALPL